MKHLTVVRLAVQASALTLLVAAAGCSKQEPVAKTAPADGVALKTRRATNFAIPRNRWNSGASHLA